MCNKVCDSGSSNKIVLGQTTRHKDSTNSGNLGDDIGNQILAQCTVMNSIG